MCSARLGIAWAVVCAITWVISTPIPLKAQPTQTVQAATETTEADSVPPSPERVTPTVGGVSDEPMMDILIEGIGFSKLILQIEPGARLESLADSRTLRMLIEENLCWSGLFDLTGGSTRYCRLQSSPSRVDMRLRLVAGEDGQIGVQLRDGGPEEFVLYEEVIPLADATNEPAIMDLVNRLAERITGQPGLLGSTIAFVLRQPGYSKVIVATSTHGTKLKLISTNQDISLLPKWAPTGNALVYTVLGRNGTAVYFHNLVRDANGAVDSRYLTPRQGLNSGGTFSPDERRLAFTMSPEGNANLFEYDFERGTNRQLTFREGIETSAVWSPDARDLVFVSDRTGTPQVYLLDLETLEDLRLTFDSTYNADPKYSPDGDRILFTKRVNGRDQIHIMDRYGDNVRPVTSGSYDSEQAEWSPDGKQIAFTSNRTGTYKIYIVSVDGRGLRRLTNTPARFEETSPAWTWRQMPR